MKSINNYGHVHYYYNAHNRLKGKKCFCHINVDHKNSSREEHEIKHYIRESMFEEWIPIYKINKEVQPIYPIWLTEHEKDMIVAHWEKTGMFGTLIPKIRSAESVNGIR